MQIVLAIWAKANVVVLSHNAITTISEKPAKSTKPNETNGARQPILRLPSAMIKPIN